MSISPTDVLASELSAIANSLAVRAGVLISEARQSGAGLVDTKSTATDMVTEYDRASERLIVDAIRAARPGDAIIGEEGTADTGTSGVSWLIDPIDGTTNFLFGLPGWAVSIAAADAAGTVAAAVYVPSAQEMFTAIRGAGAIIEDRFGRRPLRASSATDPAGALVATGFGYDPIRRTEQATRVARLIHAVRDIRRLGAASVDLCHTAAGRVDAYFEEGLGPWDLAAGELIAREAGCRSGDFAGGPARPAEVLVAAPGLFDALASLVRNAS